MQAAVLWTVKPRLKQMKKTKILLLVLGTLLITACDEGGTQSVCGNKTLEKGELCDATDFGQKTCADFNVLWTQGQLVCADDCKSIDTKQCAEKTPSVCGNSILEEGEECDGGIENKACEDIDTKRPFGQLQCSKQCKISTSWCFAADAGLQSSIPDAESTDALCSNGKNDFNTVDKNGNISKWFDCENFWCTEFPLVQICTTLENTDALCADGLDNPMKPRDSSTQLNGNGLTDCLDPSCFKNPRITVCETEHPVRWELGSDCTDGKDNDADGLVDCDDLDCLHVGNPCPLNGKKRILFDNAHHQTAGAADWIIDVTGRHPFPTIPNSEDDWHGAYSAFGKALIDTKQYILETLPQNRSLSYGTDEVQDLKNYSLLVIPEPSVNLSPNEIQALIAFLEKGGALLYLADHAGADRDGNTWDAVGVFNDIVQKAGLAGGQNPFGATALLNSSREPRDASIASGQENHTVIKGPHGTVSNVASFGGTAFEITDTQNVSPLLIVDEKAYAIAVSYKKGKIFAIGDSAIAADKTDSLGATLQHNGYHDPNYQHAALLLNAVAWLTQP